MGAGNFDIKVYSVQAKEAKTSQNSGFSAKTMYDEFNPAKVSTRFSKKGPFNEFRDVITVLIGLDVTGSMDIIPKSLLEGKLGSLMLDLKKTFNRPNENLQISFAGIGDAKTDKAPLQVTHFESDNRFAQQLQKIWLEQGGGGNGGESYNLLWWYAANKTHLNYVKQDNRKGILITIGDDNVHPELTANEIQMWLDPKYDGGNISNQVLLAGAKEQYDVYHIVITDGSAYNYDYLKKADKTKEQKDREVERWIDLLGTDNVIYSNSRDVADSIAEIVKRHRPVEKANMTNLTETEWSHKNKENLTDEQWQEVLNYALCPLSRRFMQNPVEINSSKKVYEKQTIEDYVSANQRDPFTRKKLTLAELVCKPNLNIAQLCSNYRPFFDNLPDNRKVQLIESVLGPQQTVETEKAPVNNNNSPYGFFANSSESSASVIKQIDQIQINLECPITHELMTDPVMLVATGHTYEKAAIQQWLAKNDTDPLTGVKLKDKTIVPNLAVRSLCDNARLAPKPT